jgi:hypothetical protein
MYLQRTADLQCHQHKMCFENIIHEINNAIGLAKSNEVIMTALPVAAVSTASFACRIRNTT